MTKKSAKRSKRKRSSQAKRDVVDSVQEDLVWLGDNWEMLDKLHTFKQGMEIVEYVEATFAETSALVSSFLHGKSDALQAPKQLGMLSELFASAPRQVQMGYELSASDNTVSYFNANSLRKDTSIELVLEFYSWGREEFGTHFKPLMARQPRCLIHPDGLLACGPKEPNVAMFDRFPLSPFAGFTDKRRLEMSNESAFKPPHIDSVSLASVWTMLDGHRIFLAFGNTDKNRALMQEWHFRDFSWPEALALMRDLEQPTFNYLEAGESIYLCAGQPYLCLSVALDCAYGFQIANPTISEWDSILKTFRSFMNSLQTQASLIDLEKALHHIEAQIEIWQKVLPTLPDRQSDTTVAKSEVEALIQELIRDGKHHLRIRIEMLQSAQEEHAAAVAAAAAAADSSRSAIGTRKRRAREPQVEEDQDKIKSEEEEEPSSSTSSQLRTSPRRRIIELKSEDEEDDLYA